MWWSYRQALELPYPKPCKDFDIPHWALSRKTRAYGTTRKLWSKLTTSGKKKQRKQSRQRT